jgi:hypothetical protein
MATECYGDRAEALALELPNLELAEATLRAPREGRKPRRISSMRRKPCPLEHSSA